jgi:LacI family transcriptional regulator
LKVKDIAKLANVSPATVSLVLNNKPGVSDDTRKKIYEILDKHGYSPTIVPKTEQLQGSIRFLKYKKHGLVVDQNGGFIASVIDGVDNEARKLGYSLVMTTLSPDNCNEVLQIVKNDCRDGIILLGTELNNQDLVFLNDINVPIVIVDNYFEFEEYDCVVMNNVDAVFKAVQYLVELGYKDIGYFHSSFVINNFAAREEGYKKALKLLGIEYKRENVFHLTPTLEGAYRDMQKILQTGAVLPSAVFSDNDTIAVGAIKALKEHGIKIPEQLSIIGFDDIPFCLMADPPLTTMRIFKEKIGALAVRRLIDKIKNNDTNIIKIQIGAELIIRGSTCKAR